MKPSTVILGSAVAAAFTFSMLGLSQVQAGPAEKTAYKFEKCAGVAKAGKNDCQTAASSCAGTSKKDQQADAWVYVPEGTCAKIVGGSVKS